MDLQGNGTRNLNNAVQECKSCFVLHCNLEAELSPPLVDLKTTQSQVIPAGNVGSPALAALGQDPDTAAPKHYRYIGLNLHFYSHTMKNTMKKYPTKTKSPNSHLRDQLLDCLKWLEMKFP